MNIYKKKLINNSLRLNSIANYFIELTDKNDFIKLHKFIKNKNLPVLVIGEGTNVVLPDIFEGIVVKPNFNEINLQHPTVLQDLNQSQTFFNQMLNTNGSLTVDDIHKKLGKLMWDYVGMARNETGLNHVVDEIELLKNQFYKDVNIPGGQTFNPELEKAGRLADFLELGQLMAIDALNRNESCGGHFREEYQTEENEALRNDKDFSYVSAWEYNKIIKDSNLHKEELEFNEVELTSRSYK